jgi:SAM-dependent methyltransferase
MIRQVSTPASTRVIDVGGGSSVLVDRLLDAGFRNLAVLDVSETALAETRERLGDREASVTWIVADVAEVDRIGTFDIWHDRALLHFLTRPEDRRRYRELLATSIPSGGHAVIAGFALDGPDRCSGLPVDRHSERSISGELERDFTLLRSAKLDHLTPSGESQRFLYCMFRRR